jgi:hypothetical protein
VFKDDLPKKCLNKKQVTINLNIVEVSIFNGLFYPFSNYRFTFFYENAYKCGLRKIFELKNSPYNQSASHPWFYSLYSRLFKFIQKGLAQSASFVLLKEEDLFPL